MPTEGTRKILSTLGMARRAGVIAIGQDRVLDKLKRGEKLFIVITDDCSASVLSKIERYCGSGSICRRIDGITREELGGAMGVPRSQIAGLPVEGGFAATVAKLLN